MASDEFLERVARDIQLSNTHGTVNDFKLILVRALIWQYEWGVIFALDDEMHMHILTDYRKKVFLRKPLREVAFFMFNHYPIIKTNIMKTKPESLVLWQRIGWQLISENEKEWHIEMKKEDFRLC